MKCAKCSKKASSRYIDRDYCNSCFTSQIERVVRRQIRGFGLKKDSKVLVMDKASRYFTERIINMPIDLIVKSGRSLDVNSMNAEIFTNPKLKEFMRSENIDMILLPWTIDDDNEDFLSRMFTGTKLQRPGKKFKKLFASISYDELSRFCEIRKIPLKKHKKSHLGTMLDKIEARHPGIKRGLLKSSEQITDILSEKET